MPSAGATTLVPVADQFWGDRTGKIMDPEGHVWVIASRVEATSSAERDERWSNIGKRKSYITLAAKPETILFTQPPRHMLRNHIRTTVTFLKNHKAFSIINIAGLTTALTVCYFAFLYVSFELSYDSFHEKADHIYRLVTDVKTPNGIDYRGSSAPIGPAVKEAFPEVVSTARLFLDYLIIQNDRGLQNEEKVAYADATVFSVFTFPLTSGDAANVLNVPFDVVLSASCARKYFGDENPVGKTLLINGKDRANVRGVMEDIPANSHLRVDMLFSMSTLLKGMNPSLENNWRSLRCNTYLLLRPDTPPDPLNAKINQFLKSKIDQPDVQYLTTLEPLRSIYLHGKPRGSRSGNAVTGNSTNLYVCAPAAALALFIACLNFVNLSTAFSLRRTKEIGVRKILGAARSGLVLQFLTDAIALSLMAFVISLGLISIITPVFNQIAGKMISSGLLEHPLYVGLLLMASLITGAISGLYPAVFVSSFKAADSAKGRFTSGSRGVALRKILVTSQFLISFVLIVATAVLYKQLHFMQNEQLGFKKDHMLAVDFQFDPRAGSQFTKNQLMTVPGVSGVSVSSSLPGRPNHKRETTIQRFDGSEEPSGFDAYFVDFEFIDQYNLKIIAGRKFSPSIASDSTQAMIINEAAVKALGYYNLDDVLGKPYSQSGRTGTIIGVVKDFHFQSFREDIQPLTMQAGGIATFMTLTISDTDIPSTISKLEKKWKSIVPDMPFSYFFTDDAYNSQYDSDRRFSQLFLCMVTVAIIISCLGLFGLTVFSTTQRTKEIGIRKVLGSSSIQIVSLITKDFFTLIATAFFLGIPVSWFLMDSWLQEFAYRTDVPIWIYGLAGLGLALVAFVTISFQTIQAANADPVRSLKTE